MKIIKSSCLNWVKLVVEKVDVVQVGESFSGFAFIKFQFLNREFIEFYHVCPVRRNKNHFKIHID
jgi:hypothetical protein